MYRWLILVLGIAMMNHVSSEDHAGMLLDYRNSFLSYEQKGLDTCPFTYFRETCTDFAHAVTIETFDENNTPKICLGTFISEQFILTTASCIPSDHPKNIRLNAKIAENVTVSSIYLHPDYKLSQRNGSDENNLALLKLNADLRLTKNVAASCLWASETVEMYTKVQEMDYDHTIKKVNQNTTICSGLNKNECLKSALQFWCQRKSSTGILQIRELGKYKMHPMIASMGCDKSGQIVPISHHLPWIREVTQSTRIEYNLTDVGLGEKCFNNEGVKGVCLPVDECPQVMINFKDLQKNNSISNCGFDGSIALTCCSTKDMLKGAQTETIFREAVHEIEHCETLYDEFRRTPDEHELHSQVAIVTLNNSTICGATLIATRFLLTSAECVEKIDSTNNVLIGIAHDSDETINKIEIQSIFPHPKFNPKTRHYNVAVIKLKHPVSVDSSTVPACLWTRKEKVPTSLDAVSYDDADDVLSKTVFSPLYYSDCLRLYNPHLIASEMCVSPKLADCEPDNEKSSCQKPGSGLYTNVFVGTAMKPVTYVVGIHSKGYQCDKRGPSIHTRVSEYYEWIKSVVYLSSQSNE
ncbi:phenoloxidase-activating factor 3-like [Toxorhynchites rutilus septentrionalis]|uniref:phenoloxidase-activating factor 3-like n=1 Tax=Toxorhynchites rutilus septentrionalis TaxID=329112 RepID=UPI00247A8B51|nr:phenoloxidase-activating factor 3-like [Toxorhynchites rutilus septentrionalis]